MKKKAKKICNGMSVKQKRRLQGGRRSDGFHSKPNCGLGRSASPDQPECQQAFNQQRQGSRCWNFVVHNVDRSVVWWWLMTYSTTTSIPIFIKEEIRGFIDSVRVHNVFAAH